MFYLHIYLHLPANVGFSNVQTRNSSESQLYVQIWALSGKESPPLLKN